MHLIASLAKAGHLAAVDAAHHNYPEWQPLAIRATPCQARTMREIGKKRGHGYLTYACEGIVILATEEVDPPAPGPGIYWTSVDGVVGYESGTGNTQCQIFPDGSVRGRTMSAIARAAEGLVWGRVIPEAVLALGPVTSNNALSRALEAFEADPSEEVAAFALAMGAHIWEPLAPTWRG